MIAHVPPESHSFDSIDDGRYGGKAWGLAQLAGMGLSVPPGFVIGAAQVGTYPDDLDARVAALGSHPVAVRSSAAGEDGEGASFAGQYDTVLNVCGKQALHAAIDHCVLSSAGAGAQHYRGERDNQTMSAPAVAANASTAAVASEDPAAQIPALMNVVVQRMVDARAAGVVFTADPHSARRDLLVIDAVAGLGEALVSGKETPDHYAVTAMHAIAERSLAGSEPILSDTEIYAIAEQARAAAEHVGRPLDLEWAIDQDGELFWLQARPITTLPADLNEFDTTLPRSDDVLTISNVSEMMPGAVCPLTMSVTGWGIDYGLQHMQVAVGARERIDPNWQITASAYGHLLLNLTGNVVMGAGVLGSSAEQTAQTLCGRLVPELRELPPLPLWRRLPNTIRLLHYCITAPTVVARFDDALATFQIQHAPTSSAMMEELLARIGFFNHTMAVHIQSSALSGFLSAIVENMVSGRANESSLEEQAEAVQLLSGATEVESAQMLHELDELIAKIAAHPQAKEAFVTVGADQALGWLQASPELRAAFSQFLHHHGHRGLRELCMRDPAWHDAPEQLVQSMQAGVGALIGGAIAERAHGGESAAAHTSIPWPSLSWGLRWILPKAHNAIRRREHTKSQLVRVGYHFKRAFRHLGCLLVAEGQLPDADLVNFFTLEELAEIVLGHPNLDVEKAIARREALAYQQLLEFPEISVGSPEPLTHDIAVPEDGVLIGRPASRGVVRGRARVALTLTEAAALQANEILVTPITDIGWTPYFSMIAGLVTDLGSSVSHGAVIAREYGLPCVVNTRAGTKLIKTGDLIELDGDAGRVQWVDDS